MPQTHPIVVLSIWLAVAGWGIVMFGRCRGRKLPGALAIWVTGWFAFVVHVISAFATSYRWSHGVALAETARQTRDLTGFDSGIGLWMNYLFGAIWVVDAVRWAATGEAVATGRWKWPHRSMHLFLAFMVFNGTVVFASGATRVFGILIFVFLGAAWFRARTRPSCVPDPTLSEEKDRLIPPSS